MSISKMLYVSQPTIRRDLSVLEKQGKVLILYPRECFGVKTASRNKEGLEKLYQLGYKDAERIEEFLR